MRVMSAAAIIILAGWMTTQASAQGRPSEAEIRYYCSLGSQTPISMRPYCRGGYYGEQRGFYYRGERDYDRDYYQRGRPPTRREIEYYCSLGDQTPISMRRYCRYY